MRKRTRRNVVDTRQEVFIVHEGPQLLFTLAYLGHIGGYDGKGEGEKREESPAVGSAEGRSNEGGMRGELLWCG